MIWLAVPAGLVVLAVVARRLLDRRESESFERYKTEKGVSFTWPGGGPM